MDLSTLSSFFHVLSTRTFWIFLIILVVLVAFWRAQKRGELKWTDMITAPGSSKLSLSKVGQSIGIVISSWAIIIMVDKDKLSSEIFGVWLAFLLGGAGWSSYLKAKNVRDERQYGGNYGGYGGGYTPDPEPFEPDIPSVGAGGGAETPSGRIKRKRPPADPVDVE